MSAMPYRYIEDIATADVAFEAVGETPGELMISAADALMHVMVDNLNSIEPRRIVDIDIEADTVELLLFRLLDDVVYYKDAERLLLRVREAKIDRKGESYMLRARAEGEGIDAEKHHLVVDVKAVTMHRYKVEETGEGWKAVVVLDI